MATSVSICQLSSSHLSHLTRQASSSERTLCARSCGSGYEISLNGLNLRSIRHSPSLFAGVAKFQSVEGTSSLCRLNSWSLPRSRVRCQISASNGIGDVCEGWRERKVVVCNMNSETVATELSQDKRMEGDLGGRIGEAASSSHGWNLLKFLTAGFETKALVGALVFCGALAFTLPGPAYAKGNKDATGAPPQPAPAASAVAVKEKGSDVSAAKAQERANKLAFSEEDIAELLAEENEADLIPLLQMYLKEHPNDMAAMQALLKIHMQEGQFNEGLEVLEQLIKKEPEQMEWLLIKAQAHEFMGDLGTAREGYEGVLKKEPYSARAMQGLATLMQKTGEDSLVLGMLEDAIQEASQDKKNKVEVHNLKLLLAQMHTLQGNVAEALQQYDELIKEDPEDFRPYLCQGLIYTLVGNKEQADVNFREFQKRCPPDYAERSHVETLTLKAKAAARRLAEAKKREQKAKARGRRVKGEMQQPRFNPGTPDE